AAHRLGRGRVGLGIGFGQRRVIHRQHLVRPVRHHPLRGLRRRAQGAGDDLAPAFLGQPPGAAQELPYGRRGRIPIASPANDHDVHPQITFRSNSLRARFAPFSAPSSPSMNSHSDLTSGMNRSSTSSRLAASPTSAAPRPRSAGPQTVMGLRLAIMMSLTLGSRGWLSVALVMLATHGRGASTTAMPPSVSRSSRSPLPTTSSRGTKGTKGIPSSS